MANRNKRKHLVDVAPLPTFARVMGLRRNRGQRAEVARTIKGFISTNKNQTGNGRVHPASQKAE